MVSADRAAAFRRQADVERYPAGLKPHTDQGGGVCVCVLERQTALFILFTHCSSFATSGQTRRPHCQACVEKGRVSGLMCSYNAVNGVPSCANHWLLDTLARREWGFDGTPALLGHISPPTVW